MPGYDGRGPLGTGPMTGRGKGYCVLKLPQDEKLPRVVSNVLSEMANPDPDFSFDETAQLSLRINRIKPP